MKELETRRITPVAYIAAIVVAVLVGLELLVVSGVLELRAGTVAKYAPWAYEPFLRLVGEHPDSRSHEVDSSGPAVKDVPADADPLSALIEAHEPGGVIPEPEVEPEPVPAPVKKPAPVPPPQDVDDAVPVG
jgi:hypothetical protein